MAKKIKRKELGKGIGALLGSFSGDTEIPVPSQEEVEELSSIIIEIPINSIEKNPQQPRKNFDEEDLELLKNSIKSHGLIQPITVRSMGDGNYQLISGERRLKASKLAGLTEVPAYIRAVNSDKEMLELALVENIHRADLNPMEVAFTYNQLLKEFGYKSQEELAERVGISRVLVTSILSLLKLHEKVQHSLKDREISRGHAFSLARVEDKIIQAKLLDRIIKEKLSVRKLEKLVSDYKQGVKSSTPTNANSLPEEFQLVQNELRQLLQRKIEIKTKKSGKGQITIPFDNTSDFNKIYDLLEKYNH